MLITTLFSLVPYRLCPEPKLRRTADVPLNPCPLRAATTPTTQQLISLKVFKLILDPMDKTEMMRLENVMLTNE